MKKIYSSQEIEKKICKLLADNNDFHYDNNKKNFCIILPPPNITGELHMGHGLQQTIMDILIRYNKMIGKNTLLQPGIDHAGISTTLVVERHLKKQGLNYQDLNKKKLIEETWKWKKNYSDLIKQQMNRIGISANWSEERFTLDSASSLLVKKVFIELYKEGLIYRKKRIVNWDIKLKTVISDLEVISSEENVYLWYIKYPLLNSKKSIIIATTRPETLFGDVAIAINPNDDRNYHLIGKYVKIPICNRIIPIISSSLIRVNFGSGCVKITPAHDPKDYIIAKNNNLLMINIFNDLGSLDGKYIPNQYKGINRFLARKKIIEHLKQVGLFVEGKEYISTVKRSEKSRTIIEYLLKDQWYMKTKCLSLQAIEAVKTGKIEFIPNKWKNIYFSWMENIEDWCISRQLYWGHRIPAWYDTKNNIYVGNNEQDIRTQYKLNDNIHLQQDKDVLDTWFSSALWPLSSLGWIDKSLKFKTFYPTSILVTGFDIIFFWVSRMIMLGLKFTNNVPFKKVLITGLICDYEGKKMSKSKGNVIDPIDIIEGITLKDLINKRTYNMMSNLYVDKIIKSTNKNFPNGIIGFGADALRLSFCSYNLFQKNICLDISRIEGYKNFCNKLWNASRYIIMSIKKKDYILTNDIKPINLIDKWIISKLQKIIMVCHKHIAIYRFDFLLNALYNFFRHEYCDWYLELSKTILQDSISSDIEKKSTIITLFYTINKILRLFHPIIPFITKELLFLIKHNISTVLTIQEDTYPICNKQLINIKIEKEMMYIKNIVYSIRKIRSNIIHPTNPIPIYFKNINININKLVEKYKNILIKLCRLNNIFYKTEEDKSLSCKFYKINNIEFFLPINVQNIDLNYEYLKLKQKIQEINNKIDNYKLRLNSTQFIKKATKKVILTTKNKLHLMQSNKKQLLEYLETIRNIRT